MVDEFLIRVAIHHKSEKCPQVFPAIFSFAFYPLVLVSFNNKSKQLEEAVALRWVVGKELTGWEGSPLDLTCN